MKRWHRIVSSSPKEGDLDLHKAVEAAVSYLDEYERARADTACEGRIERLSSKLPGIVDHRFSQLQDLEAILEHIEDRLKAKTIEHTKQYMEHYQRTLTWQQASAYASVHTDVLFIKSILTEVADVRNLYLGLMKSFEYMHFQLTNVTKLRAAGLEDAEIGYDRFN
jgi:hypothetical protein